MLTSVAGGFGTLLRRYRLTAGLSQQMLAERAGLSVAAVAALEAGRRTSPRPDTVTLLADALRLSAEDRVALVTAANAVQSIKPVLAPSLPAQPLAALPAWPMPPTALIGREREEAAIVHLLQQPGQGRLVTLTGSGGVGKTCLALSVAATLRDAYPDGVIFVDLSALRDPALVASTIAQALGVREDGTRSAREVLLAALGDRRLLLVLDNFEQVVDAAPLLGALTAECLHLTLLVTSRTALRVRAEQRFAVSPLAVPAGGQAAVETVKNYPAVRLFVTRARAVQPDFRLDATNAEAVTEICRRLDGLPLAIELAAAWVTLLPPVALLERLERRLGLLTRGAADLPQRQQTLRATIDWSAASLTVEEQALFRRLSVFVGGSTLEAVEAVCNADRALDVLGAVGSLVDKSLLRPERADEPRFGMLEMLREYAGELLDAAGEAEPLGRAHAAYYLAMAEAAEPHLRGAAQAVWLRRLEEEHDNLRAALRWSLQYADAGVGLRLGAALWPFWYMHGYISEGRRWLAQLLALPVADFQRDLNNARAGALSGAGVFAELQGDYAGAQASLEESLAICRSCGDTRGIATSLDDLGVLADSQGDLTRATAHFTQALALFRELGHAWGTALTLGNMGYLAREQGEYGQAATLYAESLTLFRQVGDSRNTAFMLNNLGEVLCDQGDYAQARAVCEESLTVRRSLGDVWGVAISLGSLGNVAHAQGEYAQAAALYEESLTLFRNIGATWNTACVLDSLSNVARRQGAYLRSMALSAESLALFRELHDAKGIARALTSSAQVAREQGDMAQAESLCRESLAVYRGIGPVISVVPCLECLAAALCTPAAELQPGRLVRALKLWGATAALRDALGIPLPAADRVVRERCTAATQELLDAPAFTVAWAQGAALSLAQAIGEALGPETASLLTQQ